MKNLKAYLLLLPALLFCSCSDFLDKDPEVTIDAETVDYTDLNNMYQPVSGVYSWLRQEGTHWAVYAMTISRDDDVDPGTNGDDWVKLNNYNYDNTLWFWNEPFSVLYFRMIKYSNKALEDLVEFEKYCKTEDELKRNHSYQGEVRILRALSYYRLVQLFGDVPILYENKQTDLHRRSVKSVYEYALEDLDYAAKNCYRLRPNQMEHPGAVSAFTAEMLAAKIHMNMGNYAEAYTLTKDIVDNGKFDLYPDFSELFKIPGKLCDESLLEIQTTDFGAGSGDSVGTNCWFTFQGPANSGNISGWGWIHPNKAFRDWAAARGETVRAETSFLYAGTTTKWGDVLRPQQGSETGCYNGKAYTPFCQLTEGRTEYGCNNNVRVFRYADVLLMYAECALRTNQNVSDAVIKFNKVRTRANMPEVAALTEDLILDERRMELCMEWGERFNDLVRTGKAVQVLTAAGYNYTDDKKYMPIAKAAIDITPALGEDVVE
ncbi:MAG: RagB/SusD family nutrient uptake outer membrane protein [Bacteroidales bacterium]|nr:RagB/SusD family nutrient uptake outer membrane protein [Bacteroidales bacterium]MDY6105020.1 RagB/SusD family nutrient uptake outer membrane protein [Candidatus Limisoma sp.]